MYTRILIVSLIVSLIVGFTATVLDLSTLFPQLFLAHFIIALVAALISSACVSLWSGGGQKSEKKKRRSPARSSAESRKETGSVKWFSPSKGFGFITRDNGEDVFVHFRSIMGEGHRVLREGQRVEFAVTEGTKGLQAEEVNAIK